MVGTGRTAQGILELEPSCAGRHGPGPRSGGRARLAARPGRERVGCPRGRRGRGDDKLARLKELEPELLVDYGDDAWADEVREVVGASLVYDGVGGAVGRTAWSSSPPAAGMSMFGYSAGTPTQFDTGDVVSRGISVSWSLGPRMQAVPAASPASPAAPSSGTPPATGSRSSRRTRSPRRPARTRTSRTGPPWARSSCSPRCDVQGRCSAVGAVSLLTGEGLRL